MIDSSRTKGRRITVGKVLLFVLGCLIVLFALVVGALGTIIAFVAALFQWSVSIGVFAFALLVGLGITFCLAWLGVKAMAVHPQQVAKVVFTSPAPINPSEWSEKGGAVKPEAQDAMLLTEAPPRFLFWYMLGQINGRATHHFAPDREVDGFFDEQFQHFAPAGVCDPAKLHLPPGGLRGNGFYSNIFTNKDANTKHAQNPRLQLSSNQTPALILTGSCNYIKWEVEYQYKQTLPNSTLLYIPRAGHVIYLDQPDLYFASIRAFLLNTPLPPQPWTSATPPPEK